MYVIREATPDDAAGIIAHMEMIAAEPDNGITQSPGEMRTLEEQRKVLMDDARADNAIFLVAVSDSGEIIGVANFRGGKRLSTRHTGGLGITVHRDWRDHGVGTAMMQHMIEWARHTGIVKRMELEVFTHNKRAFHVYKKLGFEVEGSKRKAYWRDGRYVDAYVMALLFEDDLISSELY
jgi:RimJ/RimL family protein N-acetyltransferase